MDIVPFMMRIRPNAPRKSAGWKPVTDRRREPREGAAADQALSARLIGGVDVRLRNLSTRGVLFESPVRMQVGAQIALRLRTASASLVLPGEVVRCRVSAIRHGRLRYETALSLASDCRLSAAPDGLFAAQQGELMTLVDAAVDSLTFIESS
jgi:hypothetical protein